MKKKRTQAFLIPILLSLPLLQMVAVMIVGEEPEDRCVSPMR